MVFLRDFLASLAVLAVVGVILFIAGIVETGDIGWGVFVAMLLSLGFAAARRAPTPGATPGAAPHDS